MSKSQLSNITIVHITLHMCMHVKLSYVLHSYSVYKDVIDE